jgi:hypothetical protein
LTVALFVVLGVIGASSFANDYSQTFEFKGTMTQLLAAMNGGRFG